MQDAIGSIQSAENLIGNPDFLPRFGGDRHVAVRHSTIEANSRLQPLSVRSILKQAITTTS